MEITYWDQFVLGLAAAVSLCWLGIASWAHRWYGQVPQAPPAYQHLWAHMQQHALPPRPMHLRLPHPHHAHPMETRYTRKTVRLSPDMQSMLERMGKG